MANINLEEKKTLFEDEQIKISTTGHVYDFVGVVENKSQELIKIKLNTQEFENDLIEIPKNDWVGFLANDEEIAQFQEIVDGNFEINGEDFNGKKNISNTRDAIIDLGLKLNDLIDKYGDKIVKDSVCSLAGLIAYANGEDKKGILEVMAATYGAFNYSKIKNKIHNYLADKDNFICKILTIEWGEKLKELKSTEQENLTLEEILEKAKNESIGDKETYGIDACKKSILFNLEQGKSLEEQLKEYIDRANDDVLFNKKMVLACYELIQEKAEIHHIPDDQELSVEEINAYLHSCESIIGENFALPLVQQEIRFIRAMFKNSYQTKRDFYLILKERLSKFEPYKKVDFKPQYRGKFTIGETLDHLVENFDEKFDKCMHEFHAKGKNPSVDLGHGRKRVETERPEGVSEKKESPGLGKKQDIK